MIPVIRVRDDTFARLQRFAEPLVDTPDDVLQKVLALAEERLASDGSSGNPVAPDSVATANEPTAAGERRKTSLGRRTGRRRRMATSRVLESSGELEIGTELVLLIDHLPPMDSSELHAEALKCIWDRRQRVVWRYDDRHYTLSALTRHIRDEYDVPLPLGEINGYKFWGLATDPTKSLWEIAEEQP